MEIWHTSNAQEFLEFRQLRVLEIYNCDKFSYLLTPSMASCLVHLTTLILNNCRTMEQVIIEVGEENQVIFPQILTIRLLSCSDLKSFYKGSQNLEIQSLCNISVKYCPKMVTFASTSSIEHEKEASRYLFSSKVKFPNLKILRLHSINIQQIWHIPILEMSSPIQNMKGLMVDSCDNLEYLLTSSMDKSFEQLTYLLVCDCKMMEGVILTEESMESERMCEIFFPKLVYLALDDLPKLTRFYFGNNYLEFPCLGNFQIRNCPVLKTLISSSIFGDMIAMSETAENTRKPLQMEMLPRLEELMIWNYDSEEIFDSQRLAANQSQPQITTHPSFKIVFQRLTKLCLYGMPKLKSFCHQMHTTEWPSLKKLEVHTCNQVQIFASEFPSFQKLNGDDQLEIQIQSSLFWISKDSFPSLEELSLEENDIIKEIWCDGYPADYFPKLKVLQLICFWDQSALLPSFFFQSLPDLEKIILREVSFDEIFQCQRLGSEDRPADLSTRLSSLKLSKLNELTHLWKEDSDIRPVFYNLSTLEVLECSKLRNLVPSIVSFENLQSLEVSRCHELINLVKYSTAKSLVRLTRMSITDCDKVEEIVACLEDDVNDGIVLTKLNYLQLRGLPGLASFCLGKCKFEFLSLEEVIVIDCPNMQIFSSGELSTPKLQKIKLTEDNDKVLWEGNLNSTIQQFMQKGSHDSDEHNADGSK